MQLYLAFILALIFLLKGTLVQAVCPVCTVAVGAGLGLSRWLGIDDSITGLWIGGLTVSFIIWTLTWLAKKKISFKGIGPVTVVSFYLLIILPLYWGGLIGHPANAIWGIDRFVLGIIAGSAAFFGASSWYEQLKKKNNNHAHFPFQKIVMPVGTLVLLSGIFYFLIN